MSGFNVNLVGQEPWELRGANEARIRSLEMSRTADEATLALVNTGAWTTYTPVLTASVTNPTLGSGALQNGRYTKIGRTVIGQAAIFYGTAGVANGVGEYRFSLPPAGTEVDTGGHNIVMGTGHLYDNSTNTLVAVVLEHGPGQMGYFLMFKTTGTGVTAQFTVTENSPWVWAASDQLIVNFAYETTT